jgi:hypothetical protein
MNLPRQKAGSWVCCSDKIFDPGYIPLIRPKVPPPKGGFLGIYPSQTIKKPQCIQFRGFYVNTKNYSLLLVIQ